MLLEEREQLGNLVRQLMVLLSDLNDVEKTFSRIREESKELYEKLDAKLDAN